MRVGGPFKGVATVTRAHLAAVAGGEPPSAEPEGAAAAGAGALSFLGLDVWVLAPSKALASTATAAIRMSATSLPSIAFANGFRRCSVPTPRGARRRASTGDVSPAGRKAGAKRGPRRDGDTRLIESRIVLELQSARGIRSAYGSIGT